MTYSQLLHDEQGDESRERGRLNEAARRKRRGLTPRWADQEIGTGVVRCPKTRGHHAWPEPRTIVIRLSRSVHYR